MFKIKSYLQYKNTPDNKPRVLVEGVDYDIIADKRLFLGYSIEKNSSIKILGDLKYIANLSDCRSLLGIQLKNYRWTKVISNKVLNLREMQVVHYLGRKAEDEEDYDREECWGISVFREGEMCVFFPHPQITWTTFTKTIQNNSILEYTGIIASTLNYNDMLERFEFFDFESDPAKYSQILWNCSESEGWEKIFKLLNIKN